MTALCVRCLTWPGWFCVLALLFSGSPPRMQAAEINIGRVTVQSAASVDTAVLLNSAPDGVASLQFDILFNTEAISIETAPGEAANQSGKMVHTYDPAPGIKRVLIIGLNTDLINDGPLVVLTIRAATSVKDGVFELRFAAPVASAPDGQAIPLSAIDGQISVTPAEELPAGVHRQPASGSRPRASNPAVRPPAGV